MTKNQVTIKDVAREANVSIATVSRVINNQDKVKPETVQKIKAAMEKLNFHPNALGRNLRKMESRMILIILPSISNPFFSKIVDGMGEVAMNNGYNIMICPTKFQINAQKRYMNLIATRQAEGAVFLACEPQDKEIVDLCEHYPVLQCGDYNEKLNLPRISIDNKMAAYQVTKYLLDMGHKRIGFIGSVNNSVSSLQRLEGYKEALRNAGVGIDETLIAFADSDYSYTSAGVVVRKMLDKEKRPTAVFAISDIMAIAVMNAAKEMGFGIPDNLSIFGFDDIEMASMTEPKISSVNQSNYIMGKRAMRMLLDILENRELPERQVYVEHQLLIRGSTGAAEK